MGESESRLVVSDSLWPHGLYSPWNSPGQNTGVDSPSLRQRIFPTQGSNPGLPHGRQILYQLSHQGSPRILEWVTYPFSRGSSFPRNRIGVSWIAGGFFTIWATREVYLMGTGFQFGKVKKFWRWMLVTIAQQCEYTQCYGTVFLKVAKMMNFILCAYVSNK